MVEILQCNNLTDHAICFFLRTNSWDPMSRVNVHSCSPKHWTSCVHWLIFRGWSFNPVVYPQRWKQQKVSSNQTCCDNNRSNYFKHLSGFVLRGQVTRQTLNWPPVRQERESAFWTAPNGPYKNHRMEVLWTPKTESPRRVHTAIQMKR